MKVEFDKQDFRIIRLTESDAKKETDNLLDFKELILQNETAYPSIDKWYAKKVVPGLRAQERTAFVGYLHEKPVVSAVVKKGRDSKFCHLRIDEHLQGENLGELFFALMAFELRHIAKDIHFTLPESLWESKSKFFKGFGFESAVKSVQQYRLFDKELVCHAPFSVVWGHALEKLPKISRRFNIGNYSMQNTLLMSVQPEFGEMIISGSKRVEVRRKFSSKWIGHRLALYSSRPQQCLIGEASIKAVIVGSPEYIWNEFGAELGCSRERLMAYSAGLETVYAIVISDVLSYQAPLPLNQISHLVREHLSPPQSFCSLENNGPWAKAVSVAAMLHSTSVSPTLVFP